MAGDHVLLPPVDLSTWLVFLGTEVVLAFVPGPAVCFVVAQGVRRGTRAAMAASLGILLANAVWFAASALGLGAVLVAVPGLLLTLRWLGAGYVAWLGLRALWPHASSPLDTGTTTSAAPLRAGFVLQMMNPKALLFFAAILPGFVADDAAAWPAWLQIGMFGLTSIGSEIWVLFGYGALAAAASARLRDGDLLRHVDRATGLVLLAVAWWLLVHA